jgi:hypothetical protein
MSSLSDQDWTPVVIKRTLTKKEIDEKRIPPTSSNESRRLYKLDSVEFTDIPKKRVDLSSIQELIQKRGALSLTQDKADQYCMFPRNTFREIEGRRLIPNEKQQSTLQRKMGVQIKILS